MPIQRTQDGRDFCAYPKDPGHQNLTLAFVSGRVGEQEGVWYSFKGGKSLLPKEVSLLAINKRFCGMLSEM